MDTLPPEAEWFPLEELEPCAPPPSLDPAELAVLLAKEYLPESSRHQLYRVARAWTDCIEAWPEEQRQIAAQWADQRRRPPTLVVALPGWREPSAHAEALAAAV